MKGQIRSFEGHRLTRSGASAIDCDALAAEAVGRFVGLFHGGAGCVFGEVYGLADGSVAMVLEGGLHFDVPIGPNIVCASENPADSRGDCRDSLNGAGFGDLPFKFLAVEAVFFSEFFEYGIYFEQSCAVEDLACKYEGIGRLNAARAISNDAYSAGGSGAGDGGVAELLFFAAPDAAIPIRKGPSRLGQLRGGLVGLVVDEFHKVRAKFDAPARIVGYSEQEQAIGKAHYAEADLAVGAGQPGGVIDGVIAYVDDIIEEAHGQRDGPC